MSRRDQHHNDLGEVKRCDCGGANFTIGPMTLHFIADEVRLLADLVRAGVEMAGVKDAADPAGEGKTKSHGTLH